MMPIQVTKVLIVDDNPEDRMVFKRYIKRGLQQDEEPTFIESDRVKDAIKQILEHNFDCILLDYKLPDMTGNEMLKEIQNESKITPPIIMLTGQKKLELAVEALKLGAEDYLVKDEITQDSICRIIQNAADKNSLKKQIADKENEIKQLAYFDYLTQLPNRFSIESTIRHLVKDGVDFTVVLVDLDRFKNVNDTLGHEIGDLLIKEVSTRMQNKFQTNVVISRLGGDEFILLRKESESHSIIEDFANDLINIFKKPFIIEQYQLNIQPSIGIANFPSAGQTAVELMKNVDIAMFKSKEKGGNQYSFYTQKIEQEARERVEVEQELRRCLKQKKIKVFFQPIVNLDDESLFAVESLIRFDSDFLSTIDLDKIIIIAEQASLITEIGSIFMDKAIYEYKQQLDKREKIFYLTINLSGRQLESKTLTEDIIALSIKHAISPKNLIFELTESAFIENIDKANELLSKIVSLGSLIYIDDFGTGFSSLSLIQKLPLAGLKIDKSFVIDMERNPKNAKLVNSIIMLAQANGLAVTAEGVETLTELTMLKLHPNVKAQGYYISRPVEAHTLGENNDN